MERSNVRRGASWMLTAFAVAITGCGDDGTGPGGGGGGGGGGPVMTTSVTVVDNAFQPGAIQVAPGATVTWTWQGTTAQPHNVTFSTAAVPNGADRSSGTYVATMPSAPGTYDYQCTNHTGMTGSILVS